MISLGDYKKNDTIYFAFTTRNSTGEPTTVTTSPAISVYKDANDAEFTTGLTVDYDFDTRSGLVHVTVVTTDSAYTTGSTFHLVFTAGQIGTTDIAGEVVARFTLEATAGATRSALGLTSANLDTQLSTIDTVVDAVKAKTDNLPTDPADQSILEGKIDTIDTVVDAIKVKTDALPTDPADASDIAVSHSSISTLITTVDTVVDAIKVKTDTIPADTCRESYLDIVAATIPGNVWNFNLLANIGTAVNRYSPWNAMRHIICKWAISSTTKTVYKEDNATTAYTTTLTLDGDGEITGDTP